MWFRFICEIVLEMRGRPRFEVLYHLLRERITLLDYLPGAALTESELAEEFGISRTPVRHGLQPLESDGLLETQAAVGSFVTSFNLESMKDSYLLRKWFAELVGAFPPIPSRTSPRKRTFCTIEPAP